MVNTANMVDINNIYSSGIEYANELSNLANEAIAFLKSNKWCNEILEGKLDRGWGYIMAVFFFTINTDYEGVPNNIWVITGDLPPAYIDANDNPNGACAIDAYVTEMEQWVDNVLQGKSIKELIPVNAAPTRDNAMMLQDRLNIVKNEILANLKDELVECQDQATNSGGVSRKGANPSFLPGIENEQVVDR